jgi:hypothetical protein
MLNRIWKLLCGLLLMAAAATAHAETKLDGMSVYLLGSFVLDKHGEVRSLTMASSKSPEIDAELLRNISGWKYHPVMLEGTVADVGVVIDVRLDATLRPDGQVEQVRIASVRHELKDRSGMELPDPLFRTKAFYPLQYLKKNMEASVQLMLQFGDDGYVRQVGVSSLRLFPAGRQGLSDAQKAAAARAFSEGAMSGMQGLKVDLFRLREYNKQCAGSCPPVGKTVFFNLPPGDRYRSWRAYQDVVLPPLPWVKYENSTLGNQQIRLIDPAQTDVLLRHIP